MIGGPNQSHKVNFKELPDWGKRTSTKKTKSCVNLFSDFSQKKRRSAQRTFCPSSRRGDRFRSPRHPKGRGTCNLRTMDQAFSPKFSTFTLQFVVPMLAQTLDRVAKRGAGSDECVVPYVTCGPGCEHLMRQHCSDCAVSGVRERRTLCRWTWSTRVNSLARGEQCRLLPRRAQRSSAQHEQARLGRSDRSGSNAIRALTLSTLNIIRVKCESLTVPRILYRVMSTSGSGTNAPAQR